MQAQSPVMAENIEKFLDLLADKGMKPSRAIRLATVRTRRQIQPGSMISSAQELDFFVDPDPLNTSSQGWPQLTDEPRLKSGESTPSDSAYGIIAHSFSIDSNRLYGAAPTEVNSAVGVLASADARVIQGGSVVMGPHAVNKGLNAEAAFRISTNAATPTSVLMGGIEGTRNKIFEPTPVYVKPATTVTCKVRFDGSQFATRSPAVTANFFLYWEIEMLVANF